jgi:glycosyltransferase involved in cell wall biosynthesis
LKILLINNYHYRKGGADGVYFNTAELLKKHGHEVFFFSVKHPENVMDESNSFFATAQDYRNISAVGKLASVPSFFFNRSAYKKLMDLVEKIKPDLAHIHLFMGGLSASILLALKKKKIPVVHSVHDYRLICPAYLFLDGKNKICEKCKDKFYLHCTFNRCSENKLGQSFILSADAYVRKYLIKPINLIDRFIFVSKFSRDKHIEFNAGYAPKSEMLYNFRPELEAIRPTVVKGSYFLYFGRISREKGVGTLIEAAAKAGISLKIAGDGPLLKKYSVRHFDNIEFLGHRRGHELWSLIQGASFIIVPSEWYENNPLTIIESYALGKPVIGARIGGIPEILKDEKTGYLFEPGDQQGLEQILQKATGLSDAEYIQMSTNARTFAEQNFDPVANYRMLVRIYEDVIKTKNKI